jgi:hypothetical protein
MVDDPGLYGLRPGRGDGHTRLLVTDDRTHDALSALVPDARAGMITVCAAAVQCTTLLNDDPAWRGESPSASSQTSPGCALRLVTLSHFAVARSSGALGALGFSRKGVVTGHAFRWPARASRATSRPIPYCDEGFHAEGIVDGGGC